MEKYWQIEKMNLKYHVPFHVLACVLLLAVSPLLMGTENLPAADTAKVLEYYVALMGIVMAPPIFLPEQNRDIRELVFAKYTDSAAVYLARLLGNMLILGVLLGVYLWTLKNNRCEFPAVRYYFGVFAEMLFLGGLGLFFYGVSDNYVLGYMVPVIYYLIALGSGEKYLKLFYPFSMSAERYAEKIYLFAAAVVMTAGGVYFRCRPHSGICCCSRPVGRS